MKHPTIKIPDETIISINNAAGIPPEQPPSLPQITIKTDGAKIKAGMATIITAISAQVDATELATVAPIKFRRRKAVNALAQVSLTDAQLVAEFGSELTPAEIRAQITSEYAPVQAAATAEIARLKNAYDRKRAKLVTLSADIASSTAAELIALITQGAVITPYSVRAGFKTWVETKLAAQVDTFARAQELHTSAIDAIASIYPKLQELSDTDLATTIGQIDTPITP